MALGADSELRHPARCWAQSASAGAHRILDGCLVRVVAVGVAEHVEVPARQEGVPGPALRRVGRKVQLPSILPHPDSNCIALQPTNAGSSNVVKLLMSSRFNRWTAVSDAKFTCCVA
jgi:hypothetical protein